MTALKISRDVFIRAAEAEVNGYRVRAAFRVRDEVIEQAGLESEPKRAWEETEARLRGARLGEWTRLIEAQRIC